MSVGQMLCHLIEAFRCPLGEREIAPFRALPVPGRLFKWVALYFPRKWPAGVPTPPEIDQKLGGRPPAEFAADRDLLLATVEQFAQSPNLAGTAHPMWGPLTQAEWMRWGYLHTDHHLRQFGR